MIRQQSGCMGKERFEKARTAETVVKRMRRTTRINAPLHAYACAYCDGFHIGTDRPRAEREKRRPRYYECA